MVVTEKISNLFGRKKVKREEKANRETSKDANPQMFGDCYEEFRRNLSLEKEL